MQKDASSKNPGFDMGRTFADTIDKSITNNDSDVVKLGQNVSEKELYSINRDLHRRASGEYDKSREGVEGYGFKRVNSADFHTTEGKNLYMD